MPSTEAQAEKDRKLAEKVRDADVVLLVKKVGEGRNVSGVGVLAFSHEFGRALPYTVEAAFTGEEEGDPDGFIRQVTVKAGWNRTDWRKLDRAGLTQPKDES